MYGKTRIDILYMCMTTTVLPAFISAEALTLSNTDEQAVTA